ncbi:hypothetical protein [Oscillibacter ruminantium]|uniref:hypothetical protein n=1 Tax=Oscillibacter ruminantium TaxID=1263547 RepID=UPI00058F99C8|nr:hypothetical protein [Oscillibacter ruminantium]
MKLKRKNGDEAEHQKENTGVDSSGTSGQANRSYVQDMRNNRTNVQNYGSPWTEEDKRELTRLYLGGVGITEIAVQMKRREEAILSRAAKMGLKAKVYKKRKKREKEELS